MVLISLLSNDLTTISPLIYEFKEQITQHITLYDDSTLEQVHLEDLTKGIEALKDKYSLDFASSSLMIDEDSSASIESAFEKIMPLISKESKLYLNSSSSMVNVTLLLSSKVFKQGGKVLVYDKYDNNYNVLSPNSMKTKKIQNSMKLDDFLMMLDKPILEASSEKKLKRRKKDVLTLFGDFKGFSKVRNALLKDDLNFAYQKYQPILDALKKLNIVKKGKIDKSLIGGGLFEEYIYWLVKDLGFDDVKCNVKIQIEEIASKAIKNEVDVMMIKENHIYMIECKLSSNLTGIEVIYKYDSIMSSFGDDSKTMIVNVSNRKKRKFLNRFSSENFKKSDLIRGLFHNIDIYHQKELDEEVFKRQMQEFFEV
jgi:hypothetical protein